MIVNLVLFSGIYYMKVKNPENDFLALKLDESLMDEEEDLMENGDKYDCDNTGGRNNSSTNYQTTTAFDRTTSFCSDNHMENIEKVRSLSFV